MNSIIKFCKELDRKKLFALSDKLFIKYESQMTSK